MKRLLGLLLLGGVIVSSYDAYGMFRPRKAKQSLNQRKNKTRPPALNPMKVQVQTPDPDSTGTQKFTKSDASEEEETNELLDEHYDDLPDVPDDQWTEEEKEYKVNLIYKQYQKCFNVTSEDTSNYYSAPENAYNYKKRLICGYNLRSLRNLDFVIFLGAMKKLYMELKFTDKKQILIDEISLGDPITADELHMLFQEFYKLKLKLSDIIDGKISEEIKNTFFIKCLLQHQEDLEELKGLYAKNPRAAWWKACSLCFKHELDESNL